MESSNQTQQRTTLSLSLVSWSSYRLQRPLWKKYHSAWTVTTGIGGRNGAHLSLLWLGVLPSLLQSMFLDAVCSSVSLLSFSWGDFKSLLNGDGLKPGVFICDSCPRECRHVILWTPSPLSCKNFGSAVPRQSDRDFGYVSIATTASFVKKLAIKFSSSFISKYRPCRLRNTCALTKYTVALTVIDLAIATLTKKANLV